MNSKTVELIYDQTCPNVPLMREQLLRVFADTGLPAQWQEWERGDPKAPAHVRLYGSPTLLVNGHDIVGADPAENATSCRLYRDTNGAIVKIPPAEVIAVALRSMTTSSGKAPTPPGRTGIAATFSTAPAVIAALLPNITCPACWPVYAGLLSTVGIEFSKYTEWLLPATATFLAIAVGAQLWQASRHRNWTTLVPGILGAVLVMSGRFVFPSTAALYGGLGLLVCGSLWNTVLLRQRRKTNTGGRECCRVPVTTKGGENNE